MKEILSGTQDESQVKWNMISMGKGVCGSLKTSKLGSLMSDHLEMVL